VGRLAVDMEKQQVARRPSRIGHRPAAGILRPVLRGTMRPAWV
jgi:hypothetical protein